MTDKTVMTVDKLAEEIIDRLYGITDNMKNGEFDWAMVGVDEAQELLDKLRDRVEEQYDEAV